MLVSHVYDNMARTDCEVLRAKFALICFPPNRSKGKRYPHIFGVSDIEDPSGDEGIASLGLGSIVLMCCTLEKVLSSSFCNKDA